MPIYEYMCLECNEKFALLQSLYPADDNTECPKCHAADVKKMLSSFSCGAGESASSASTPSFGGGGG